MSVILSMLAVVCNNFQFWLNDEIYLQRSWVKNYDMQSPNADIVSSTLFALNIDWRCWHHSWWPRPASAQAKLWCFLGGGGTRERVGGYICALHDEDAGRSVMLMFGWYSKSENYVIIVNTKLSKYFIINIYSFLSPVWSRQFRPIFW